MTNPVIDEIGNQHWLNEKKHHHRTDGPAFIQADGFQLWYIDNKIYNNNKSFQKAAGITNEQMQGIIAKYGDVK